MSENRTHHPGPQGLAVHLLTRSELGAMVEHFIYRADATARGEIASRMPDAYNRLTGAGWKLGAPNHERGQDD